MRRNDPELVITLERRYGFCASHLYRRREWSEEENQRVFGKCSREPGHGHNYRLYVAVSGAVDPETGFLVDLAALDRLVDETVVERLDHRHLNEAIEDFRESGRLPTSENLVAWIYRELRERLPDGVTLTRLRLEEADDLAAELRIGSVHRV